MNYFSFLNGLNLNEFIIRLEKHFDAYIEAVLYARFSYKHNIKEINRAIENYRNNHILNKNYESKN